MSRDQLIAEITGYAYEHMVVTRVPEGNLQYETQSHAKRMWSG
jgi:hypothetical protein